MILDCLPDHNHPAGYQTFGSFLNKANVYKFLVELLYLSLELALNFINRFIFLNI